MSWHEVDTLTLRYEFVTLALQEGCEFSTLCKHFDISRKTGYKWVNRFIAFGEAGLTDQSRRPHNSPERTKSAIEDAIVALRNKHPTWGARKLKTRLNTLGHEGLPAPSTITEILRRKGLIDPAESGKHKAFTSFEHPFPNDLWQMDFKGHFPTRRGRCHPLTVLDDHSRYSVLLKACPDEKVETVREALITCFRRYGIPYRMTMDNGSPWGSDEFNVLTVLTAWLIQLGIIVSHSRPYHPETQGKDERFHRTLKADVINGRQFMDLTDCQRLFDEFRDIYNLERPHQSLEMKVPVTRYQPSNRLYPETLPPIEYDPDDEVRKVQARGEVHFKGHVVRISKALQGYPVAFRPTKVDGTYSVYFCHQKLKEFDLKEIKP